MTCKFSILINCCLVGFGLFLLMHPEVIEKIIANYNKEFKLYEVQTQTNVNLTEFYAKMLKLFSMLPTRKTDDIRVINKHDPFLKDFLEEIMVDYIDVIQLVPKAVEGDTYDFITEMRNYSIQLDKAKKRVENATEESPEYQKFQEHHKAELIKLMGRFNQQMIDVADRYWNSLSAEMRTDAQKEFYGKIQEIKFESNVEKGYDHFVYILLKNTAAPPHVEK